MENKEEIGPIELYAELSRGQLAILAANNASLEFPYGTNVKVTGRRIFVECENIDTAVQVADALDESAISWSQTSPEKSIYKIKQDEDAKNEKFVRRISRYRG